MNPEELQRMLSTEPDIMPSSAFTQSVMHAVRTEVQVPPLLPFPWVRALPGIVACCIAVLLLVINVLLGNATFGLNLPIPIIVAVWHSGLNWLTLTLAVSTSALWVTRRLLAD